MINNCLNLYKSKSAECINCQSCIPSCPKNNTLEFKVKNKSIKPVFIAVFVFVIFFGGIGITKLMGIYEVTPPPITFETAYHFFHMYTNGI